MSTVVSLKIGVAHADLGDYPGAHIEGISYYKMDKLLFILSNAGSI
jgi:hypothetical protein